MKKGILIFLFTILAASVFAATKDEMTAALSGKNSTAVKTLLETSKPEESADLEALILDEAKSAVTRDDLEFASTLADIVLMHNFDNKDAQKLYTSVEKAKKAKAETQARKEQEEKKRQQEAEEKKAVEEYKKAQIEEKKAKEEYIESVSSIGFKNFPIQIALTPVAFDFASSDFAKEYNPDAGLNVRYGAGGFVKAGFIHPYFEANIKIEYTNFMAALAGSGSKSDLFTRLSLGIPTFSKWFRFTASYGTYSISDDEDSAMYTKVNSPRLGAGIENLKFGDNLSMNLFFDLDLITFDENSTIDMAYGGELGLRYLFPKPVHNQAKIFIESDTTYYSIRVSNENEWNLDTKISVGVSLNGK